VLPPNYKCWLLEPRDPIILRDGKPFNAGDRAKTQSFPMPSSTAGATRTRAGKNERGVFDSTAVVRVVEHSMVGPLLVETENQNVTKWLMPIPADVLALKSSSGDEVRLERLVPLQLGSSDVTDLDTDIAPVGLTDVSETSKPAKLPNYWYWDQYHQWLLGNGVDIHSLGHDGPVNEYRMHVEIERASQTAAETRLFQTGGLEFARASDVQKPLSSSKQLALWLASDAEIREDLSPIDSLGSERRMVMWQGGQDFPHKEIPPDILTKIVEDGACRVVLLTPGIFADGYKPSKDGYLLQEREGITARLEAIAVHRYQVISGWDYLTHSPKPTRRVVPAGTTFYLSFKGQNKEAIEKWVRSVWFSNVSDAIRHRHDGFGLAVLGVWDGKLQEMKVNL
jgi:CRISPR-associated protein Cmr3